MGKLYLFLVTGFALHSSAWSCITPPAELSNNGAPIAGLASASIHYDRTSFVAGTGDQAVRYSVYPTYATDKTVHKVGTAGHNKRVAETEICIEVTSVCKKGEKEVLCLKRDVETNPASRTENAKRLANSKSCANFKDLFTLAGASQRASGVSIQARDFKGGNVAKVHLNLTAATNSDQRAGSLASEIIKNHKICVSPTRQRKPAICSMSREEMQTLYNRYKKIENRISQYDLEFVSADQKQRTEVKMTTSYYEVADENQPRAGKNIQPVEAAAPVTEIDTQAGQIVAFHDANILFREGSTRARNFVEYSQNNSSTRARGLPPMGEKPGSINVGVASTPMVAEHCKLTGGKAPPTDNGQDPTTSLGNGG